MRAQTESAWHSFHSSKSVMPVTSEGLLPGTKYGFRARAGALPTPRLPCSQSFIMSVASPQQPAFCVCGAELSVLSYNLGHN